MTNAIRPATKQLLDYLPAIYHESEDASRPSYLELYLRAFERVLFGSQTLQGEDSPQDLNETVGPGLEEEIALIPSLLDPLRTPEEFLPWLANWAALSFHPDLSTEKRRNLLAHIIPLYRIRGTSKYIEAILGLCLDTFVLVTDEDIPEFQLGHHSTIGVDTYIGGAPPHFFTVRLIAPNLDDRQSGTQVAIAHAMLSLAKPAHTCYDLALISPRMQVGVHSTVGVDTVLSTA